MMKKALFLAVFSAAVLSMAPRLWAQQGVKVGYVDIQRVIKESKAGKRAKAAFEKEFMNKKSIIDRKQKALDELKKEFFSKAPVMDEEARKKMADDIERKEKELKRMRADFRDELQKRDFELTQKILSELEGVLNKFGKEHNYTLIVEKTEGGVVYASPETDVTDEVIKAYDATKK